MGSEVQELELPGQALLQLLLGVDNLAPDFFFRNVAGVDLPDVVEDPGGDGQVRFAKGATQPVPDDIAGETKYSIVKYWQLGIALSLKEH